MVNQEHFNRIKQGIVVWNDWRKQNPVIQADLSNANLGGADLGGADLGGADLSGADFSGADLSSADLSSAKLRGADLSSAKLNFAYLRFANLNRAFLSNAILSNAKLNGANLSRANLSRANLNSAYLSRAILSRANLNGANLNSADLSNVNLGGADLGGADLSNADFNGADLSNADLSNALLVKTNFTNATLTGCYIYGVSAWDIQLEGAIQENMIITDYTKPTITLDNLEVAQFLYLLLNNTKIREVINTLTTKAVLILGRFTPERKEVLDALREALRKHNYLPILFDFDPASTQTVRETVRTLAHLSHFIIADLTNPNSIPEELETIIPTLAVPIQPLLEIKQKREFSMFKGFGVYPWVLPIYRYTDLEGLINNMQEKVIEPAAQKARELADKKVHLNQEPFQQTT